MPTSDAFDYWASGRGIPHITPPNNPNPEGDAFFAALRHQTFAQNMVEFGCGTGRLAKHFAADDYSGVDICPKAIEIAKRDNPHHQFRVIDRDDMIMPRDLILAHTVLLHVPDDEIEHVVSRFAAPRVLVSEILGRSWRRAGNPPVFNRGIIDYNEIFKPAGYRLHRVQFYPYPHYPDTDIAMMEFHRDP